MIFVLPAALLSEPELMYKEHHSEDRLFPVLSEVNKFTILLTMKNVLLISLLLLAVVFKSQAQPQVADTSLVIQFESLVHDYGTIVKGSDGTCEFKFVNAGKTPLIIQNVSASCGCTVPEWTKEPVQPGKSGKIKVSYNTAIISGFTKTVTVVSNARNNPVILTIKGVVTDTPATGSK